MLTIHFLTVILNAIYATISPISCSDYPFLPFLVGNSLFSNVRIPPSVLLPLLLCFDIHFSVLCRLKSISLNPKTSVKAAYLRFRTSFVPVLVKRLPPVTFLWHFLVKFIYQILIYSFLVSAMRFADWEIFISMTEGLLCFLAPSFERTYSTALPHFIFTFHLPSIPQINAFALLFHLPHIFVPSSDLLPTSELKFLASFSGQ